MTRTSKSLRPAAAAALVASLVCGSVAGGATSAMALSKSYAYTSGSVWAPQLNFGLSSSFLNGVNRWNRGAIYWSCQAMLAKHIPWYLFWANDPICNVVTTSFYGKSVSTSLGICGTAPLRNIWAVRVWYC